jgi:hypothetical protein
VRIALSAFQPQVGASSNTLEIRLGQVYRATVVEVIENGAMLRMGGSLIEVNSDLPLQSGQVLFLKPELTADSLVILRMVNQGAPAGQETPLPQLEHALAKLGVPVTPRNLTIARALLTWSQPVNLESVETLGREVRSLPMDKLHGYLNVRGWIKSVGLTEERATINVVTRFLLGRPEPTDVPAATRHINESQQGTLYPEVGVLWWHNGTQHGEIYLFEEGKGTTAGQGMTNTLAVRIQTVNWGEIWVTFTCRGNELDLLFVCPLPETLSMLREKESVLASVVSSVGLSLQHTGYRQERPASFLDVVPPVGALEYKRVNVFA